MRHQTSASTQRVGVLCIEAFVVDTRGTLRAKLSGRRWPRLDSRLRQLIQYAPYQVVSLTCRYTPLKSQQFSPEHYIVQRNSIKDVRVEERKADILTTVQQILKVSAVRRKTRVLKLFRRGSKSITTTMTAGSLSSSIKSSRRSEI